MSVSLSNEQITSVLQGIAIPSQPQVLVDIQMEQCAPNCSVNRIADLISQDVGLSGSILKTVNSPAIQTAKNVTSITQAVSLLGVESVISLVNAHSIKGSLSDDDIVALGRFWDSAMDVAHASVVIAKELNLANPDEAYTLGLFHNCGVPLMMSQFKNYEEVCKQSYSESELCITGVENSLLRTNHAVVGYYVARSWNLPDYMAQAIHDHHNISKIFTGDKTDSRKKQLLVALKIAEHLCGLYHHLGGQTVDKEWEANKAALLMYAGLTEYELDNISSTILDLGLGDPEYH